MFFINFKPSAKYPPSLQGFFPFSVPFCFPGALVVKSLTANRSRSKIPRFQPWVGKIPKEEITHSICLAELHGWREPRAVPNGGHKESDMTK